MQKLKHNTQQIITITKLEKKLEKHFRATILFLVLSFSNITLRYFYLKCKIYIIFQGLFTLFSSLIFNFVRSIKCVQNISFWKFTLYSLSMHNHPLSTVSKKQQTSIKSIKFNAQIDQINQVVAGFEETSILSRYHQLQKYHLQQLAAINMNDALKRKLFGFSQVSYLINDRNPDDLVLQNHPLMGRTIMTKARFERKNYEGQGSGKEVSVSCSDGSNPTKGIDFSKMKEANNKFSGSRQLLIDEDNETKDLKIQKSESRLMGDSSI